MMHWVFGHSFESHPRQRRRGNDTTVYEDSQWRIQLSPVAESAEDLFLNAMLVTHTGNDRLPDVAGIDQGNRVGVVIKTRGGSHIALFDRSAETTDATVAFTLEGDGRHRVFVADLAAGIWQIRRNGVVVEQGLPVQEGAGCLYFEGPAGAYELLR